jgi:hypothetical protein
VIGAAQIDVNTLFGDSAGDEVADLQNQAYMADSKDINSASPNSDTRLTNLLAAEHKRLEDHKENRRGGPATTRSGAQGGREVVPLALQGRLPPKGRLGEGNKRRLHISRATTAPHDR